MKTALLWTLALLMLAAPGAAEAAITVSITATRGSTTTPAVTPTLSSADGTAVFLACTSATQLPSTNPALCSRDIVIGTTKVTISDISPTNRARVYKTDGLSSDILNLAGMNAKSFTGITATSAVTLKISYSTAPGDYTALVYNLYAYTAAMSGSFFRIDATRIPPVQLPASACAVATPACVTLKLTANNVIVNQFGDNAVATVNVAPIGSTGAFGPPTLNPAETKSIPCGVATTLNPPPKNCIPTLQGELTAIYKGSSETLQIVGGAALGGSNNPITSGGVIDTTFDVSAPENITPPNNNDQIVDYTQEPTLHANLQQDGASFRNISNSSKVQLAWSLEKVAGFTQTDSTLLNSTVSNGDSDLFNKGAYVAFVATQGQAQVNDITSIVASYEWATNDCSAQVVTPPAIGAPSSWFVEFQLVTFERIRIFLGGSANFLTQCNLNSFSDVNLVGFNGKNVQLPDGSFVGYNSMKGKFGSVGVRAISLFLTQTTNDQKVDLTSFTIGAFNTTFARVGGRTPNFAATCDFPGVNEFLMRFTAVDQGHVPVLPNRSFVWGAQLPAQAFVENGCQLRNSVPTQSFPAPPGGLASGFWRIELLFNLVPVGQGFIELL